MSGSVPGLVCNDHSYSLAALGCSCFLVEIGSCFLKFLLCKRNEAIYFQMNSDFLSLNSISHLSLERHLIIGRIIPSPFGSFILQTIKCCFCYPGSLFLLPKPANRVGVQEIEGGRRLGVEHREMVLRFLFIS